MLDGHHSQCDSHYDEFQQQANIKRRPQHDFQNPDLLGEQSFDNCNSHAHEKPEDEGQAEMNDAEERPVILSDK